MSGALRLQFGNCYSRRHRGYMLAGGIYGSPCYGWMTPVSESANMNVRDLRLEGYDFSNRPSEFQVGLPAGTYRVVVTSYDRTTARGPFSIRSNGQFVARDIEVPRGKITRTTFKARVTADKLTLEFVPDCGRDFAINTLEITGPGASSPVSLFKTAPPATVPTPTELSRHPCEDPRRMLRRVCDWLLRHARTDGFLGDAWGSSLFWYTVSMPARALLAGYDILGRREYLDAALKCMNLFVGEQLPNGAFEGVFRGTPTTRLPEASVKAIMKHSRQPMSDIGSVVSTLAVAIAYAPERLKERYVQAVTNFCDKWAPRFQKKSGAFSDGLWDDYTAVYTCATAIQASTFSLAAKATGRGDYLKVAAKAMNYLLRDWLPDGRMVGRAPHWTVRNRKPFVMETLYFGDQWYYDEGFITAYHHLPDGKLRQRVNQALVRRVFGARGLLSAIGNDAWWPLQNIWNNAKSVGMVQTLLHVARHGKSSPRLQQSLANTARFLCVPELAARVGVMPNDDERPARLYSLTSWAGMAMEATGFAGMTLAEMIKPGILYLASSS